MRLSEAIRLGSMATKQCFGHMVTWFNDGEALATCATGAAAYAVGLIKKGEVAGSATGSESFALSKLPAYCPGCPVSSLLWNVILHLNDTHRWSRERIADLVESVEGPDVPQPVEAEECVAV